MALLTELQPGVLVRNLLPGGLVSLIAVIPHAHVGVELVYSDADGNLGRELVYSDGIERLEIATHELPWSFDADGATFRLVSEAYRIRLAHLFDPLIAVHTSQVEPLPHQITAVYETMLTRQPLRYLLADDPGAGKTIMTGLLIRELIIRGDLHRCLIISPGNLVEQWQDELRQKFHTTFSILTNDQIEASATGNPFNEMPLCIARLDKLSRDERLQDKLRQTEWDLIVVDEAHKMSATFFSGEVKRTKRYQLGQMLGNVTRHLLLLTATPHNGKEEDFQLLLALLDSDRFEGKFRDGVHKVDVSDIMRHLVKEQLLKFDGNKLFPDRFAYARSYELSALEMDLYHRVTEYVQQEFNRADKLHSKGRRGTVGFALTTLQRRLASSPEAIYQSLKRRRERLEARLVEAKLARQEMLAHGEREVDLDLLTQLPLLSDEELDDLDDVPSAEVENLEESVVDLASAAQTVAELQLEIDRLGELERLAMRVRVSASDRKWDELSKLLQDQPQMFNAEGYRRKLVVFTEHRDTLNYLAERIRTLLGREDAVATIHGGMNRETRMQQQESFLQRKDVQILLATDAAGEGVNLQRANLMINYDLPWNPNRLEQRFGRIHRIGQEEPCYLWNLVAEKTREGDVYNTLLEKLKEERVALGGQVFDVLGKLQFDGRSLRDVMIEAIRHGDEAGTRERLQEVIVQALDREHLKALIEDRALAHEVMDRSQVHRLREEMERAEARRLQPHFISAFFLDAFRRLGGRVIEREHGRYEIKHVPPVLRNRIARGSQRAAIAQGYERVTFEKHLVSVRGKPQAALICPGHPLLDATIEHVLEQYRDLLKRGAVLVDPNDQGEDVRVLFYLEHTIQDASVDTNGKRREVSRQLQFVELDGRGEMHAAGYAPFLDYRSLQQDELALAPELRTQAWLSGDLEERAKSYAILELLPKHLEEVQSRRESQVSKTREAVHERLTKEILYWDGRAATLKTQEAQGKINAQVNSQKARQRAEELEARLSRRMSELEQERHISPLPPVVVGGVLVVPQGVLDRLKRSKGIGEGDERVDSMAFDADLFARETAQIERAAMDEVMRIEREMGYQPRDVSASKCGYDIESRDPEDGHLRFIEVKGRVMGAESVIVTKNEILTALNKPEAFILAVVLVDGERRDAYYVRQPFHKEPDFDATGVIYKLNALLDKGVVPVL